MSGNLAARRCAVYTRKSSEEGLEQNFNSLNAQRESCEAFIKSQIHEGWQLVHDHYDDGGFSGGNINRPALVRLLADIDAQKINVVVVYKVDRLTRSLVDFAKIVEIFDRHGVSFVAVTQQFNTTTSMGRLTLNVLLSFAQFEREVAGERIRDKIAASKQKGMWMGGNVPLGYLARDRKLIIDDSTAETVRTIFCVYLERGNVRRLKQELDRRGIFSRGRAGPESKRVGAGPFWYGPLYGILRNPIYVGKIRHGDHVYPGQHQAIVSRGVWDDVQRLLIENRNGTRTRATKSKPSPLARKLFDERGVRLTPSHSVKKGRRYRYYVSQDLITGSAKAADKTWRVPAGEIERTVLSAIINLLENRGTLATILRDAGAKTRKIGVTLDAVAGYVASLRRSSNYDEELFKLMTRAILKFDTLTITLSLDAAVVEQAVRSGLPTNVTYSVPLILRRRSQEVRLIIQPDRSSTTAADPALLKAVARAHRWFQDLASGKATSITELARRNKVSRSYVGQLLPLAFLAPDLVSQIVDGRQMPNLTANSLIKRGGVATNWAAQGSTLLGVEPSQFLAVHDEDKC